MTVRSDIQSILRTVPTILGETTWTYRRLTSGPAAETRTYGSATAITVHSSGRGHDEVYDEPRGVTKRVERMVCRVSDAVAVLHQGDQFIDAATDYWNVVGLVPGAQNIGTVAYNTIREIPLAASPNRNGGV